MLTKKNLKKYARMYLMNRGLKKYSQAAFDDKIQYWQAGKGVSNIKSIESGADVIKEFAGVNA